MKLLKWLFNPEWFLFRMDGGGGGGAPAQQTNISDLPEWAKPYAQKTLAMAEGLTTRKDAQGNIVGPSEYQTYGDNRIAGYDPLQQMSYAGVGNMQVPGQTGMASDITEAAALRGLNAQYRPGYFGNQFQTPDPYETGNFDYLQAQAPELTQYQMGPAERVRGGNYRAPMMDTARTSYSPDIQAFQMDPTQQVRGGQYDPYLMDTAQTDYNPNLQQYQMGPAERVTTQDYTGQNVEQYMNPFMQNVVDKQTREAERQAGLAAKQRRAQAIQQGAFGGGRAAIAEAAANRDLAQLKSDIYGTGQQAAFQNAQQQFNTQQQREMAAQQANQAAGLTVGGQNLAAQLGVQQLGTQTGQQTALANLNAQQQANVQNQAAKMQAQGLTAQQAMQAALANQQSELTVGQQNLASRQGAQQLGTQTGLQTALANLTSEQQANVQNQAAQLQAQGLTAGQAMQAALANQQAGLTVGQQNLAANLGIQQLGSGQNMQAQLANQQARAAAQAAQEQSRQYGYGQRMTGAQARAQYGLAGQQLGEQSRQYGAGYGLQGLGTALTGAGQLGNLGQTQFGQQKDIYGLQNQFGGQRQALEQQFLNQQYQDFMNQQRYPYQQLEYMSNIMRGTPMGTVNTMYAAQPSMSSQLAGLGLAGAGMYGLANRKKGGAIKDKEKTRAGLNELALMKMGA